LDGRNETLIFSPEFDKVIPKYNLESYSIIGMSLNDTHDKIAMMIDLQSTERPTLFIKDLKTNTVLKDQIENCSAAQFSACSKYVYFIQKDSKFRPWRLCRHTVGDVYWEKTEIIAESKDERVFLGLGMTKDKAWWVLEEVTKNGTSFKIAPRVIGSNYPMGFDGGKFFELVAEGDKIMLCEHFSGENPGFFFGGLRPYTDADGVERQGWG
jgi:hypothetical protein